MKNYQDVIVPDLTKDLVERLETIFPDRAPGPNETLDEIRVKTGQVSVVRFLREQYNRQLESVLEQEKERR